MKFCPDRKIVSKFALAALVLGLSTRSVRTAETAGRELPDELPPITVASGLDILLRYAALNNAGLKSAFQQWQATLQKIPQVKALPDPKLSYGYFIRSVETRVGPQNHKLGISQMFPWFGRLKLRGEKATHDAEAAFQRLEAQREKLWFDVRNAYFEYGYLHRAIEIVAENISLLKQLEGVAQTKFKGGGSYLGVIRAQVELGKLDDRKSSLADVLEPVRARLNAALSRDPNAAVPTPKITPASALKQDDAKLFALLAESNPDLKGMAAGISREEKGVALAKKNFYPDVMLGVDYVQTGDALAAGTPGNSKDAIVAMFSINIPLWRNKLRAGVKEAKARREAAVEQRADMNHRLAAGLKMTLFRYRDAERKITLYRDSLVPQARSALSVAQKAFAGGDADFLETVDAQRLLLEFQLQAERSLANREQRLAEIRMILGDDL
ncbi:MAG: outer membrane protein TolC [Limisphaerales bacterium]|jgi:cobalt-zinc-cadmium efflux system outer membrane protein